MTGLSWWIVRTIYMTGGFQHSSSRSCSQPHKRPGRWMSRNPDLSWRTKCTGWAENGTLIQVQLCLLKTDPRVLSREQIVVPVSQRLGQLAHGKETLAMRILQQQSLSFRPYTGAVRPEEKTLCCSSHVMAGPQGLYEGLISFSWLVTLHRTLRIQPWVKG